MESSEIADDLLVQRNNVSFKNEPCTQNIIRFNIIWQLQHNIRNYWKSLY